MTPEELVRAAIAVAEDGMAAGELPIGAVVETGGAIVGRAYTQEKALRRRLIHADLLAMTAADEVLGWEPRAAPVRLAVNLEPCVMCIGAAMAMGVDEVFFGLESPADGGAAVAIGWTATGDLPGYAAPVVTGGILRAEVQDQFRRWGERAPESALRRWTRSLVAL